jgi:hypothetical protein
MKKALGLVAAIALVFFSLGCSASTSSTIAFSEEQVRGDNDAVVYIFRESSMVGAAASWNVRIDDVVVGELRQNAYMAFHVVPGVHRIKIGDSGPLIAGVIVEAIVDNPGAFRAKEKETYYIGCKGFKVAFLSREQAMEALKSMKYDIGKETKTH